MHLLIHYTIYYIFSNILCQKWIEGAKVMTSISTSSKRMSKHQYTTVQNRATGNLQWHYWMNNAAVKVMCVCVKGTQFLLQALVQVAMIAIRRVHCGTIESERGMVYWTLANNVQTLKRSKCVHTPTDILVIKPSSVNGCTNTHVGMYKRQ